MHSLPHGYQPIGAKLPQTRNGALIAFEAGTTTPYALETAEARGTQDKGLAEAKVLEENLTAQARGEEQLGTAKGKATRDFRARC